MEKLQEFIAAIEREQAKRKITYTRKLVKFQSSADMSLKENQDRYNELMTNQNTQYYDLNRVWLLLNGTAQISTVLELQELVREMDMRLRYYPMMIMRHVITKDEAEIEKRVWRELVEYFNEKCCPSVEVKFLKTRCRITNNQ